jgi:hypothetical protein
MFQKISPLPSCLPVRQEKDSQRGVILGASLRAESLRPPFCKACPPVGRGGEEGFSLNCPCNYRLIGNFFREPKICSDMNAE